MTSLLFIQVLKLLHMKDQATLQQVLRITCTCIAVMFDQHPQIANQYLIEPLMKPILDTTLTGDCQSKCINITITIHEMQEHMVC